MLIRLLREYLRPYRKPLALVLLLQLAQTLATLYLPTLNADIIDKGVIVRQHALHPQDRRRDARHHARADPLRGRRGLLRRQGRDGARPRRPARDLQPGAAVLRPGGQPPRYAVADHPYDQRRPAGSDAGDHDVHPAAVRADHVHRRDHPGAEPERAAVVPAAGRGAAARRHRGADHFPDAAAVPADAGAAGQHQPGAARADHRRAGHPGVRPRPAGAGAVRAPPAPSCSTSRSAPAS